MSLLDTEPATEIAPPAVQDNSPLALIDRAHKSGANPDQLEKWMELSERWENREAEKSYARAMHACQQAMPPIHKGASNNHTRSSYATLEDVQRSARPVYSAHGFSLSFGEEPCPTDGLKRTVCDVIHTDGHMKRYHLDLPIDGQGSQGGKSSMNQVQGCISTTTYGQRRLICMVFNITLTDEDDDGQGASLPKVSEEQAIQLQEAAEGLDDKFKHAGFRWVGEMTGITPTSFADVPEVAFRDFRAKLVEHADKMRKGDK